MFGDLREAVSRQPIDGDGIERARRLGFDYDIVNLRIRLSLIGYLLRVMIGDASKRKGSSRPKMFIELQLTKRHPDNLRLGEFVGLCANVSGIRFSRIKDNFVGPRVPYGRFHWKSENSEFVYWLFTRCLGLRSGELTTWHAVVVDWILAAPKYFRISFLQGLADSDGYVHFENQQVHLIVSPNSKAVGMILSSLGISYSATISKGLDILKISINDAYRLPIFNPYVRSYRFKSVLQIRLGRSLRRGPWQKWLVTEVEELAKRNFSTTEVIMSILRRHKLLIRAANVRRHIRRVRLNSINANKSINRQIGRRPVGP